MSFSGIDVRQTSDRIIFRASLKDSSNAKLATGTTTLRLFELQSDGTYKSYDFNDNTFKTGLLTTATASMTHRTGNNASYNTGVWTYALIPSVGVNLAGFTLGSIYMAQVTNTSAVPPDQEREFQYGGIEGDDKLAGITLLKNWLAVLAGKTADTSTLAEVNATTAGTTYDNTTDSLEAITDDSGGGGSTAQDIWEYATRSLTTTVTPSANTNTCNVIVQAENNNGSARPYAVIEYRFYQAGTNTTGVAMPGDWDQRATDSTGLASCEARVGDMYQYRVDSGHPGYYTAASTGSVAISINLQGRLQS